MNTPTTDVQDAEIIDTEATEPVTEAEPTGTAVPADVLVISNLEQLIKTNIGNIDRGKEELRKLKEMVDSMLLNDATYQEHDKLAKEAAKIKGQTRKQILQQTAAKQTMVKLNDLKMEVKEAEDAMSDYLREYGRLTGTNEIESDEGDVREIVLTAKLVKKSSKFRD